MTGYYHLSVIHVNVGDMVAPGQHIADGGSTGLSTGPHLHWDVRIMNTAVDGLQWLEEDVVKSVGR
jgi:murein DD-endopeptidase MepM/ murein hydrolase activator NlpD